MAKLTAARRNALPKSDFGIPSREGYPMENKSHAIAAKGRADEEYEKGNLSASQYETIMAKANKKLGEKARK